MARNNTIDIMKGIAIIAVIAGHVFPLDSLGRQLIYSFHMPLFFIVAGYLFKPNTNYRKKLSADFSRLLVPYLFIALCFTIYLLATYSDTLFALRYSFIAMIFGSACNHASYFWSAPPRIGAAWFLPALFWCRQIYNFVYCHTNNPRYIIATIAFTATITDFYLINLPFAILPGSSAMMFYMIGNVIRSRIIEKPVIIALSVIGVICWLLHICYFGIEMSICKYGFYPIDVLGTSFATAIIFLGSRCLSNTSAGRILGKIGEASLYVYCFHTMEAEIKPYEWLQLDKKWYIEFIIRALWCVIIPFMYLWLKKILKPEKG